MIEIKRLPAAFYRTATGREPVPEIRSDISQGRIARVIFCVERGELVLLHAFIKKRQRTPKLDLVLAMRRKKEIGS